MQSLLTHHCHGGVHGYRMVEVKLLHLSNGSGQIIKIKILRIYIVMVGSLLNFTFSFKNTVKKSRAIFCSVRLSNGT